MALSKDVRYAGATWFQKDTISFCTYPNGPQYKELEYNDPFYPLIGLIDEGGELADKIRRVHSGDESIFSERATQAFKEAAERGADREELEKLGSAMLVNTLLSAAAQLGATAGLIKKAIRGDKPTNLFRLMASLNNVGLNLGSATNLELNLLHEAFAADRIEGAPIHQYSWDAYPQQAITSPEPDLWARVDDEDREAIVKEAGDAQFYLARVPESMRVPLGVVMATNFDKLNDRAQRGVLKGDGDNR